MRIKIIQKPRPVRIEDVRLDCFEVGQTYDVSWQLGSFLLIQGWADVVSSVTETSGELPNSPPPRRQTKPGS